MTHWTKNQKILSRRHGAASRRRTRSPFAPLSLCLLLPMLFVLGSAGIVRAEGETPADKLLESARFDQKLDAQVPLDLTFRDDNGKDVRFGDYFGTTPVILVLAQYSCPNICDTVLEDLVEKMRDLRFELGKDFTVVTLSIDPHDSVALARQKRMDYLSHYGRAVNASSWRSLTGTQPAIEKLADAIGFRYAYDEELKQYAHPSGLVLLTPKGRISSYLYGLVYSTKDLRLGLVDASEGKIGSPLDKILLRCYHYNPITGKYTGAIMEIVRAVAAFMTLAIGLYIVLHLWREKRGRPGSRGPNIQQGTGSSI